MSLIRAICLLSLQCLTIFVTFASTANGQSIVDLNKLSTATIETQTYQEMEELFQRTEQVMLNKLVLDFLNKTFPTALKVPAAIQSTYGLEEKSSSLSTTQVLYILHHTRIHWALMDMYFARVTKENLETGEIKSFRKELRKKIRDIVKQNGLDETINQLNNPTQPVQFKVAGQVSTFDNLTTFVNHPSLNDPMDPHSTHIPADDLKQVVLDFIAGAKKSIMYNVFEFNLLDIAKALAQKNKEGVSVHGGIDEATTTLDERNIAVRDFLLANASDTFKTTLVESAGLNHQKIMVRDWGTPNAAILYLSGNFTQSCIGPEGDLMDIPESLRPQQSIPNANHAISIKGLLPALVTYYQLRKTLIHELRGQNQYPVDGSYLLPGPKNESDQDFIILAYSPNGGMGDVNKDLIHRVITESHGPIWTMQFAFSSPELIQAIEEKAKMEFKEHGAFDFRAVGDPPFARQYWSGFLALSGLQQNTETKIYSEKEDFSLKVHLTDTQLKQWRSGIRIDPKTFGEFHIEVNGEKRKVSAKVHHKVMIFLQDLLAIAGTSFNPSNNAEGNQEQLMLIHSKSAVKRLAGAFAYLYFNSPESLHTHALRRNRYRSTTDGLPSSHELEGQQEIKRATEPPPQKKAKSCERPLTKKTA